MLRVLVLGVLKVLVLGVLVLGVLNVLVLASTEVYGSNEKWNAAQGIRRISRVDRNGTRRACLRAWRGESRI